MLNRFRSVYSSIKPSRKQTHLLYSTQVMSPAQKLKALRSQFDNHGIGIYVALTQDEHDSEYTSLADNRREFISGKQDKVRLT